MKKEAASAGVLDTVFGKFARLQILTIEDLFAGKKPAMPPEDPAAFRKAAREEDQTRQAKLIEAALALWNAKSHNPSIPVQTVRQFL